MQTKHSGKYPYLEAAVSRSEILAKNKICELADELFAKHYKPITGLLVKGCWTTHSLAEHRKFADPVLPFTVLIPTKTNFSHTALRDVYQQTKQLFKYLGTPVVHWQSKGMLIAIGFDTDLKRIERMADML
jgi:hypothetical protein